jgi:hypothetical protein
MNIMRMWTKHLASLTFVLIAVAILYTLLMLKYRSVYVSDLAHYAFQSSWSVDSLYFGRHARHLGPQPHSPDCRSDTGWYLYGVIYARNNVRKRLDIDSVLIVDTATNLTVRVQIDRIAVSSGQSIRGTTILWKEPFRIPFWATSNWGTLSALDFKLFVERGFKNRSFQWVVWTSRGSIALTPEEYFTIGWYSNWRPSEPWPQVANPVTPGYTDFSIHN